MKPYKSLFRLYKTQIPDEIFAHFYAINQDYDAPWKIVATETSDGLASWGFQQAKFQKKYPNTAYPKLKNYLNYTFRRSIELEQLSPGRHFAYSNDSTWVTFNTGLQNNHGADLYAIFQRFIPRPNSTGAAPDWVYKGCYAPTDRPCRIHFGSSVSELPWYSRDSRDFVFDTSFRLERDVFGHLFDRAKERAGLPNAPDEVVRNYLRGAIENLIPKIHRNYKIAIPVYYVEEGRMQLLLPFISASDSNDVSCFLVERDDNTRSYELKTIFDLDHAYFAARLITRPDKEWLNP